MWTWKRLSRRASNWLARGIHVVRPVEALFYSFQRYSTAPVVDWVEQGQDPPSSLKPKEKVGLRPSLQKILECVALLHTGIIAC